MRNPVGDRPDVRLLVGSGDAPDNDIGFPTMKSMRGVDVEVEVRL